MTGGKFNMKKLIALLIVSFMLLMMGCNRDNQPNISKEKARNFANELYNRQLFKQSAEEYARYLQLYKLENNEQANISYTVGDIYFERLKDYENALAFYIRAKYFNPKEDLKKSINKKIVACLERLERTEDAKQTLTESTSLEPDKVKKKRPGKVVALIGTRQVTQGDIDFELSQLPPELQSQYQKKEMKVQFLRQYILTELLYDSAKRKGIEKDTEVIDAAFQAKKGIMVRKYLQDEIQSKVTITPEDVELYYNANTEKYAEKDKDGNITQQKSFQEVQQQAAQDYAIQKQQQVYDDLAQKLMRAEGVKIYDDVLK
jgi:tetratricopeptide (TPR) repeat protein